MSSPNLVQYGLRPLRNMNWNPSDKNGRGKGAKINNVADCPFAPILALYVALCVLEVGLVVKAQNDWPHGWSQVAMHLSCQLF